MSGVEKIQRLNDMVCRLNRSTKKDKGTHYVAYDIGLPRIGLLMEQTLRAMENHDYGVAKSYAAEARTYLAILQNSDRVKVITKSDIPLSGDGPCYSNLYVKEPGDEEKTDITA